MNELKNKLKRQIEIVGICLSEHTQKPLKTFDLADMFKVDEVTIKRDLTELRGAGIDIHSVKRKGVCLSKSPGIKKIVSLIHQYAAITKSDGYVERATALLTKCLNEKALAIIVTIQMGIEKKYAVFIDYEKENGELEKSREIFPLLIFQSDNYWRVLAGNEGKTKQFHLNKVTDVRLTKKKFKPFPSEGLEEIFKYSWRSWLGSDKYKIKLKFSKQWAERIRPKHLIENEVITENNDGSIIFEATVNSLDEISGWIVSRGAGINVLEPYELKEKVIELAKGALGNYL